MNPTKISRIFLILTWMLIFSGLAAYAYLQPKLPTSVLDLMAQNPGHFYAWIILGLFLCLLLITSIRIWQRKQNSPRLFFLTTLLLPICLFFRGTYVVYPGIAFFDDSVCLILGIVIGLLLSKPYNLLFNHTKVFNLATTKNLNWLCGAILVMFGLVFAASYYTDPSIPKIFSDFVAAQAQARQNYYWDIIRLINFFIFPLTVILLFFKSKLGKYLFILSYLICFLGDAFPADASTGVDALAGSIFFLLIGITLAIIHCEPLSQQFKKISNEKNIFRTIFLSFYSKSFYKEVAFQWQGRGLYYLLSLAILFTLLSWSLPHEEKHYQLADTLSLLTDQAPKIRIHNNELSIDQKVPYTIYDKNKNPIVIIDTSGKYNSLDILDESIKILVTKNTVFVRNPDYNYVIIKPIKTKSLDLNISQSDLKEYFISIKVFDSLVIYSGFFTSFFISYFLLSALIAVIGLSGKKLKKIGLDFKTRWRLIILVLTPLTVTNSLMKLIFPAVNTSILFPICSFLIYFYYSRLIVKTVTENSKLST